MKKELLMTIPVAICTIIVFFIINGGLDTLFDSSPDDTIYTIRMGDGQIGLKNGSYVDLPENLKDDFYNQSFREFEFAMKERGIFTYSQLCQYDSLMWGES